MTYSLSEAIALAKIYYSSNLPFAFEGPHGIGKSLSLKHLADTLEIGFVDLRLSLFEETDLIGAPYRAEDSNQTAYTRPIWLTLLEATGKKAGLLCLEELNRCDALVRQPALQLIWDRKCSHWNLPTGWLPIATWNPPGKGYETVDLDDALLSRLAIIPVRADVQGWLVWAKDNKVSPSIMAFIEAYPDFLSNEHTSPRTWAMAGEVMRHFPQEVDALKPILRKSFVEFSQFLLVKDLPRPDIILNDPKEAKQIAEKIADNPTLRFSFESQLITCVIARVNEGKVGKKLLEALSVYLENVPPDTVIAWFERLKTRDKKVALLLTKALGKGFRPESRRLMQHIFGEV